jgi:hypothetical protein
MIVTALSERGPVARLLEWTDHTIEFLVRRGDRLLPGSRKHAPSIVGRADAAAM